MIKKLLALGATALFSLNATAGYVRYDFASTDVSGFFVQNEEDLSIAYYDFYFEPYPAHTHFQPSGSASNIIRAMAGQKNTGPSSFKVFNATTEVYYTEMRVGFIPLSTAGTYRFDSYFTAVRDGGYPTGEWVDQLVPVSQHSSGTVKGSALDADFSAYIDMYREMGMYPDGLKYIVPSAYVSVPEPTSIALLTLGVAGLVSIRRRKQSK